SGAVTGPMSFDWDAIFAPDQLDDLEVHGVTTIPDDSPGTRRNFTISKQTLVDLSMVDTHRVLDGLDVPVLVIHDEDDRQVGLVEMSQENFRRLPEGSRVEVVPGARFGAGENPRALSDLSLAWAKQVVPVGH
ncbi:MAG: alpha/beta hydrolase, partial [Actinomyces sp.]|nr:alpha/beta hydrolase [Actinomyces sp.]